MAPDRELGNSGFFVARRSFSSAFPSTIAQPHLIPEGGLHGPLFFQKGVYGVLC